MLSRNYSVHVGAIVLAVLASVIMGGSSHAQVFGGEPILPSISDNGGGSPQSMAVNGTGTSQELEDVLHEKHLKSSIDGLA